MTRSHIFEASIKPLSWTEESEADFTLFSATTSLGRYSYGTDRKGIAYHQNPSGGADHASEQEARAAAEDSYSTAVIGLVAEHCIIANR